MSAVAALDRRSLTALILEWFVIAIAVLLAQRFANFWSVAVAFIVVATRQHALLIIYHDAVHGHLSRNRRLNDLVINAFVGVPVLMPVEFYRPLHLEHHRTLGTDRDPERQLLYANQPWNYRPLPPGRLFRQLFGDLLVVNGGRSIAAWWRSRPVPSLPAHSLAIIVVWVAVCGLWLAVAPAQAIAAMALWFAPLLTLTQLLQKLRSYAEHSGGPGVTPGWQHWTYSWRPGFLGRLTIWPYNINYHREHHERPELRWHEIPADSTEGNSLPTAALWSILSAPPRRQPSADR